MSHAPEKVLQKVLARGFIAFRRDSRLLDSVFCELSQEEQAQLREVVSKHRIPIEPGLSPNAPKVPSIQILLREDRAVFPHLGDFQSQDPPDDTAFDSESVAGSVLGGAASVAPSWGEGRLIFGPYRASGGTRGRLDVAQPVFHAGQIPAMGAQEGDPSRDADVRIHIVAGKGEGDVRRVESNTRSSITPTALFSTTPDSTTVFVLREYPSETVGEPSRAFERSAEEAETRGAIVSCTYLLQVIGPNPTLTACLASLVRLILIASREFLERCGLHGLQAGMTDFGPRMPSLPDGAYQRTVSLEFFTEIKVAVKTDPVVEAIQVILDSRDVDEIETTLVDPIVVPLSVGG